MKEVSFQKTKIIHTFNFFAIFYFLLYGIFFNKHQEIVDLRNIIIYIDFLSQVLTWPRHIYS